MFADWGKKRGCGSGRDYRVEPGNDMGGETVNAIVEAVLRGKARQGLEGRRRLWRRGFVGGRDCWLDEG